MNLSSNPSSSPNPDDEILAQLIREWDHTDGQPPDVEACIRRYPHLETQIRDLHEMRQAVDGSRSEMPASVPERLGEFRIVRRMEVGPMGEIYEAVQERLGRRVVVKVLPRGRHSPDARARFMREQQVLARLHQTHIVPIHTAGCEGKIEYFVMPYIAGSALRHVVHTAADFASTHPNTQTPSMALLIEEAKTGCNDTPTGSYSMVSESDEPDDPSTPDPAASSSSFSFKPSLDYLRSVARVMADAATALQHAHELGIYHRDVKPSNIMVEVQRQLDNGAGTKAEPSEKCWVIDFGLASYRNGHRSPHAPREESGAAIGLDHASDVQQDSASNPHSAILTRSVRATVAADSPPDSIPATSGIMGTPQYMAPEQFDGKADARTDVWGLGVTLYELLTLRRAFPKGNAATVAENLAYFRDQIQSVDPPRPRGQVPRDLEAICFKAIQKRPGNRYQTVREFGEDLRRWLRDEPVRARKSSIFRRVALWAKRNKGWSTAIAVGVLASLFLSAVVGISEERRHEGERQALIRRAQGIRQSTHRNGWTEDAWQKLREAARIRKDENLRDQAVATLVGLDVRISKRFENLAASSVAFDRTGKWLLIGGTTGDKVGAFPARVAKVSDWETERISLQSGPGPVTFGVDGTPLQLIATPIDRFTLLLWDVAKNQLIREFKIHDGEPEPLTEGNLPTLAISPDGSLISATTTLPDGSGMLGVWDVEPGKLIHRFPGKFTAIAFSPDNALIAAGDEEGNIFVRSLPNGELVTQLKRDRLEITCLAFNRDNRRRGPVQLAADTWLLAAGDAGGTVAIWDCATRSERSVCKGSHHHVHAAAFSPDGMTLASVGRSLLKLWDVATGRLLIDVHETNWMTGVAFSPDGTSVVVSSVPAFGSFGQVTVWDIESGRGVQTLRGLASQVEKVTFSQDDRLLAALSHDSRVAIWDLATCQLLHVFDAPVVSWVDNAALAFSQDSQQLAFAGSSATAGHAKVWDVASGKELASRQFSPGMNNVLAFHPSGKLLLFQVEARNGDRLLDGSMRPRDYPRVLRVRDLLGANADEPLLEISRFNYRLASLVAPDDGRFFAVVGYAGDERATSRQIAVFNTLTGDDVWHSLPETGDLKAEFVGLATDRTGRVLMINRSLSTVSGPGQTTLIELPSGKLLGPTDPNSGQGMGWSPQMPYWLMLHENQKCLVRRGEKAAIAVLGIDLPPSGTQQQFNVSGHRFAWCNVDGTVNVCDIPIVQGRLAAVGLGW